MIELIAVAVGGAIGALGRHVTAQLFQAHVTGEFPWSTLVVNVVGSFLIGFAYVFFDQHELLKTARAFAMVGILGAFTTFSTYSLDAIKLFMDDRFLLAGAYVLSNVVVCLIATLLAILIARMIV